ncbi:winged helix-turn-helix domain-containing protein [Vibrio sp. RE88]|uniref:transcriptional regulator n=1 Tax=Vibrio sp. RE88 TaxID=2607610 RepID=UPI001493B21D|nr:winged helix-turn-helix domain-containing protein [Vibrio sp. RE88]NOH63078.1 hypothetical protein [Vibrio sp. RE88]
MIETSYKLGSDFIFYPRKNQLTHVNENTEDIVLGSNESRLLTYFLSNSDRTISRNELVKVLWEEREIFVDDSSLTQSVSTLRKALSDSSKLPMFIKTVPKKGYEFIALVEKNSNGMPCSDDFINDDRELGNAEVPAHIAEEPTAGNIEITRSGNQTSYIEQLDDLVKKLMLFTLFILASITILYFVTGEQVL